VPNVTFYVDGVSVAVITTNYPITGTTLDYVIGAAAIATANQSFFFTQMQVASAF
jgi:hypothetical protein